MKMRAVLEVIAETYEEQQMVLTRFPNSYWNITNPPKAVFYIPYCQYEEVKKMMVEISINEMKELERKTKNV